MSKTQILLAYWKRGGRFKSSSRRKPGQATRYRKNLRQRKATLRQCLKRMCVRSSSLEMEFWLASHHTGPRWEVQQLPFTVSRTFSGADSPMDWQGVKSALLWHELRKQKKAGAAVAATWFKSEATSGLTLLAQLVTARRGTGHPRRKPTRADQFFELAQRLLSFKRFNQEY
jgi:hypothetical protein